MLYMVLCQKSYSPPLNLCNCHRRNGFLFKKKVPKVAHDQLKKQSVTKTDIDEIF